MTTNPSDSSAALFDRLRDLIHACDDTSKHDQAIAVITACISEGVNTRPRLVGAMRHLGFDYRHAALTLNNGTGSDPERHRWQRDAEGRYSLLA